MGNVNDNMDNNILTNRQEYETMTQEEQEAREQEELFLKGHQNEAHARGRRC